MQLFLEPVDVWLFRDGRPFDALSDHRAQSVFPPYPSVLQGAIRSHQLVLQGIDLTDPAAIARAVGTADDVRGLRLRGPFLARQEDGRFVRYLPAPADAVTVDRPRRVIRPATPPQAPPPGTRSSAPMPMLLGLADEPSKPTAGPWLREDDLRAYLGGGTVSTVLDEELFCRESRFGIGRDDVARTAREGALYEAEFIRPQPAVGLLVEVEGYDGWPAQGLLRLGGEGRGAWFTQVAAPAWPAPPDPLPERFKVYFATPAGFTGGWQPRGGDWGAFFEGEVRLVAAALDRYRSAGGFDLARGGQKPARRHVPAGSVYYFQASGRARLRPERPQQAITEFGAEVGFGQILIAEWEHV